MRRYPGMGRLTSLRQRLRRSAEALRRRKAAATFAGTGRLKAAPTSALACLLVLAATLTGLAHHSFAMFDHTRTLTLRGTVTKFQWTNPHGYLDIDVPEPNGAVKHYTLEMTSINMMQRLGWRSTTIKTGDKVKAIAAPLLDGQAGGLLLAVTLPDGKTWEPGVPAANTFVRTPEQ